MSVKLCLCCFVIQSGIYPQKHARFSRHFKMVGDPSLNAVSQLKLLSQASGALSKASDRAVQRIVEIGKAVWVSGCKELIAKVGKRPMLTSKSADGTPLTAVVHNAFRFPSGSRVRRSGRKCFNILVKNQFLRIREPHGDCATRVLLQDPLPLCHGKTAHAIFQACKKDWRSLRQLGHQGCSIEHSCFDRCGFTAHERIWRQWHKMSAHLFDHLSEAIFILFLFVTYSCCCNMFNNNAKSIHEDLPVEVFLLTEFIVFTACPAHDAHNALRWALHFQADEGDLLRDAYICIESLGNSMGLITECLPEWVATRLSFVEPLCVAGLDNRRTFLDALGVESETAQMLTETLELRFVDGRLCVSKQCETLPDLVDLVTCCLMSLWKFVRFTSSRFLSVGTASRTVVAALFTGLENIVAIITKEEKGSLYYLNGFRRLNASRKLLMVKCAIVSRVAEGVLVDILEDSRVAQRYCSLWQTLSEEMLLVAQLGEFVWEELGVIASVPAHALTSDCIAAAHISFHFFWRRVLSVAAGYPWCLTRGDVHSNLVELQSGPRPDEPVSQQMFLVMKVVFSIAQLKECLYLLSDVPWATLMVEQQHGTLANLHRHPPDYSHETLVSRAMVVQLNKLLPCVSAEEKQIALILSRLARLNAKQPSRITGRHLLLAELFDMVKRQAPSVAALPPGEARRLFFKRHTDMYSRMPAVLRADIDHRAQLLAAEKEQTAQDDTEHLRAARDLLLQRLDSLQSLSKPISMSVAALGDGDLRLFDALLGSHDYQETCLRSLRDEALRVPLPTQAASRSLLEMQDVWQPPSLDMPGWAQRIANHRDNFRDTVLVVGFGHEQQFWKFIYAVQSPYYVAVCRLTPKPNFVTSEDVTGRN